MHLTTRVVGLAAAAVLALAACGGGGAPSSDTGSSLAAGQGQINEQPYENVRDGGTVTTPVAEIPSQFNAAHIDSTADTLTVWRWYNPVLFLFSAKGEPRPNPDYLTDVRQELVGGNTRVTYTIEPRAVFNDGTPIDWRAFETTWRTAGGSDPAFLPLTTGGYDQISSVTPGASPRQAVVTFRGSYVSWPSLFNVLAHPALSDPRTYNDAYVDNPHPEWGAGPYTVEAFDKQNGTITFIRNPRWWGPRGKLDRRTIVTMEATTSLGAFRNGQLDATLVSSQNGLAQIQGLQGTPGVEIRKSFTPAVYSMAFNGKAPLLVDVRVRRAIMESIDRSQLQKVAFQGLGYTEPLPGSTVLFPFQDGYQDNFSKVVQFDAQRAGAELDAAGWARGPDGVRQRGGQRLSVGFVYFGDSPTKKALAVATAAMAKNVGVELVVRQASSNDFSTIVNAKQFDIMNSSVEQSDPFGIAYICQQFCSTSEFNSSGLGNPQLDRELQAINALPTVEEQRARAADAETTAFGLYGLMPYQNGPTIVAVKQGLANYGAGGFYAGRPQDVGFQR